MYFNLGIFALLTLGIAIWTLNRPALIVLVIVSGIFCGVNNTVTTQAVMTVSPVERPVASAAYSFVRFIGGGLAPYVAGRLVLAVDIHFPFYLAAGAVVLGMVILATGHGLLSEAERVQAEQVIATAQAEAPPADRVPAGDVAALIPVAGSLAKDGTAHDIPGASVVLAAVDGSPVAGLVTEKAAVLAAAEGGVVHVVHTQEEAVAGDAGLDGESLESARRLVRDHLDRIAAHHVPAEGQVLLHAADHGAAGRMLAEYANTIGASTIVIGASTHGGFTALADESATAELRRHTRGKVLVVDPERESI